MTEFITKEQQKRIDNIDRILKLYGEKDIPDEIIHKINKKFKSTKYYNFIRTEELDTGMIIRTVDLDLSKISIPGIVVNIKETSSKKIGIVVLYNSEKTIYWKINPDKYYLFHIEKDSGTSNKIRGYFDKNK